jgi:peptide/nickel transport system permease protein
MKRAALYPLYLPGALLTILVLAAVLAPILPLHDVRAMDIIHRFAPPSWNHPLGLDKFGRDVFARIILGIRASLAIAVGSAVIAAAIGTMLGLLGGYFRGLVEIVSVRSTEVVLCLPPLLLALLVVTLLGAGATTLIVALSILFIPRYTRIVFASTLQVRSLDYVAAQETLGVHPVVILWRTILPNIMAPLLVQMSLTMASAMVLESGLSFLGLGVVPPTPSLGLMIRSARGAMDQAPLLLLWPSAALAGMILLMNSLCDRLRDVLDPHGRTTGGAGWLRRGVATILSATVRQPTAPIPATALLDIRNLSIDLITKDGEGRIKLVGDATLKVAPGETLAVVGESGSGKTLTGLSILGLLPNSIFVSGGTSEFSDGCGRTLNLAGYGEADFRPLRGNQISMVFQDGGASLNPVHRIGDQLAEALAVHKTMPADQMRKRVIDLLSRVGIPDAERRAAAYPHELSGGQRQRAMIALAIANAPRLLIADEPTTALDTTIQAQILRLLDELKRSDGEMGMIFITHNLAVVAEIADRVCVMYAGEVVEDGHVSDVFSQPRHPYTAALLASVPESDTKRLVAIPGAVPQPDQMPRGCRFAPRCTHATAVCQELPVFEEVGPGRHSRCTRWKEVT